VRPGWSGVPGRPSGKKVRASAGRGWWLRRFPPRQRPGPVSRAPIRVEPITPDVAVARPSPEPRTQTVASTGELRARDIIIKKGLSEDEILTLMRAWRAEESASVQMTLELAGKLAVNEAAVTNFLRILDEQNLPDD
jgi:hypothetical protein